MKIYNPVLVLSELHISSNLDRYRKDLYNRSGIYGIINLTNGKQYIGSAANLGIRLKEHIIGSKTNVPLSLAIAKYGLSKFVFVVYEFSPYLIPQILELETAYITSVPSYMLYNIKLSGTSM